MSTKTVSAIYKDQLTAENAITILKANGYREEDFSLLASEGSIDKKIKIEKNTKAPEGITAGAVIGGVAGACVAGLTAVGTVTLTGGAGLLAAGPIVAAFAGAGAGASTGGLIGGLIGMGIPETEAKFIDQRLGTGNVFVGINVDENEKEKVENLLTNTQAEKVTIH